MSNVTLYILLLTLIILFVSLYFNYYLNSINLNHLDRSDKLESENKLLMYNLQQCQTNYSVCNAERRNARLAQERDEERRKEEELQRQRELELEKEVKKKLEEEAEVERIKKMEEESRIQDNTMFTSRYGYNTAGNSNIMRPIMTNGGYANNTPYVRNIEVMNRSNNSAKVFKRGIN